MPARPLVGLVYGEWDDDAGFGRHAWAEVAIEGRWVPVNPTWNELPADATHIPLRPGWPSEDDDWSTPDDDWPTPIEVQVLGHSRTRLAVSASSR